METIWLPAVEERRLRDLQVELEQIDRRLEQGAIQPGDLRAIVRIEQELVRLAILMGREFRR